jgi:hypothetical protein
VQLILSLLLLFLLQGLVGNPIDSIWLDLAAFLRNEGRPSVVLCLGRREEGRLAVNTQMTKTSDLGIANVHEYYYYYDFDFYS